MSDLLDEIAVEQKVQRRGSICRVATVLNHLTPAEATDLIQALADNEIGHSVIGAVLRRRGITIEDRTVSRHRRGQCVCDR